MDTQLLTNMIARLRIPDGHPGLRTTGYNDAINEVLRRIRFLEHKTEVHINRTIQSIAEHKYPGRTIDTALPQQWVNRMQDRGFDPRGHFVTMYPEPGAHTLGFYMAPITDQGIEMAARVASMEA